MAVDDPVETETPVFTEEEVFMIASYVAISLGYDSDDEVEVICELTEEAIPKVLSRGS